MNIEDSIEILKMWNKAEELVINESTDYDKTVYIQRKEAIETLLTVYEKQQKEIEELKTTKKELTERVLRLESDKFWENVVNKDKIKAKIEEINKEMLNEENSLELFYRKKYCKEVLQSLLEKE